jgi:hypothetical protein
MLEFIQSHSDVNELSLPFTLEIEEQNSGAHDGSNGAESPTDAPTTPTESRKVTNGT